MRFKCLAALACAALVTASVHGQDVNITDGTSTYFQAEGGSNSANLSPYIGGDGLFEDSWLVRYINASGDTVNKRLINDAGDADIVYSISQAGDTAVVTYDISSEDELPFNPRVDLFQLVITHTISTDTGGQAVLDSSFSLTKINGGGTFSLLNYFDVAMEGFGGDSVYTTPYQNDGFAVVMESQNGNPGFRHGIGADRFGTRSWGGTDLDADFLAGGDMTNVDEDAIADITAAFQWDFDMDALSSASGGTLMQVGAIPEPTTGVILAGLALAGFGFRRRRR